ncbi:Alpha-ketoglutarate-dependent xanthine dioxygenase xan-1 [Staphylotrichum longicolle]|uniref:Alpha-ketoglutarate-dependent xanthine dioxygenase xan-1 n=1 Tax=Staphylotrichum longicolle TaxID=669026 RepID=A0AAD4ESB7_9PEZI|nr:Alpha-ketoglutarate-dependent xanthine dioxygenase xan-1 [Staphylotrichum longicolle]
MVTGIDVENFSDADFALLRTALFTHQVLVIKNQSHASPAAQFALTHRFDPAAPACYGHGKTVDSKRSILHPDLKTIPHQPQVQVIGNGFVPSYEGLENIRLRHPHHRTFHATAVPDADDLTHTRFYRWHIDAALYGAALAPPVVTTLLAVRVPKGRRQTCVYEDHGSDAGDTLDVPLGTTAFASGEAMYDLLSEEDKAFARTTRVEYAPHPYVWMSAARSRADGLGLVSEGREVPLAQLPPFERGEVQILPMCWRNEVTGRLALQVHPSAVRRLHLGDGSVVEDLEEVRGLRTGCRGRVLDLRGSTRMTGRKGIWWFFITGRAALGGGSVPEDEVRLFRQ